MQLAAETVPGNFNSYKAAFWIVAFKHAAFRIENH
jgi:hypothetical protein